MNRSHLKFLFQSNYLLMFIPLYAVVLTGFTLKAIKTDLQYKHAVGHKILKNDYYVVETLMDPNKKNTFFSTYDYFKDLKKSSPNIDAAIISKQKVSFNDSIKITSEALNIVFVSGDFFSAFTGKVRVGRVFTNDDVLLQKTNAILTPGASSILFGDEHSYRDFNIGNIHLKVIGIYDFGADELTENRSIYLPISLIKYFSSSNKNFINTYLVKGKGEKALRKLKLAIDKIQLNSGFELNRPLFKIKELKSSNRNKLLWKVKYLPLQAFLWAISIFLILLSIFIYDRGLSQNLGILVNMHINKKNDRQIIVYIITHITFELSQIYFISYFIVLLASGIVSVFSRWEFRFFMPLSEVLVSFIILLIGYAVITFQRLSRHNDYKRWLPRKLP